MKTVYLAGPISGLTYDEGQDWRRQIATMFHTFRDVQPLSPLRGKSYLQNIGKLHGGDYGDIHPLSSDKGIIARDSYDTRNADVVIANFLGATKVSTGTCVELGIALQARVPVVALMEPEGNPHDTHMVRGCIDYRVTELEDAWAIAATILGYDIAIAKIDELEPEPVSDIRRAGGVEWEEPTLEWERMDG